MEPKFWEQPCGKLVIWILLSIIAGAIAISFTLFGTTNQVANWYHNAKHVNSREPAAEFHDAPMTPTHESLAELFTQQSKRVNLNFNAWAKDLDTHLTQVATASISQATILIEKDIPHRKPISLLLISIHTAVPAIRKALTTTNTTWNAYQRTTASASAQMTASTHHLTAIPSSQQEFICHGAANTQNALQSTLDASHRLSKILAAHRAALTHAADSMDTYWYQDKSKALTPGFNLKDCVWSDLWRHTFGSREPIFDQVPADVQRAMVDALQLVNAFATAEVVFLAYAKIEFQKGLVAEKVWRNELIAKFCR